MSDHSIGEPNERRDDDDDDGFDGFEEDCFHCGGEGYGECPNPMECTRGHSGGSYDHGCPCASCGGSGLAKDMTIW